MSRKRTRIGISGSGYIASELARLLSARPEFYEVTAILSDRPAADVARTIPDIPAIRDPDDLLDRSDLVVECSGYVGRAARVVAAAVERGTQVVTLNAEFQVTLGVAFSHSPLVSEAQGDQPGSLAALHEEAVTMGFRPLVYASQKGFLNLDPDPKEMAYWAERQGISVASTVAFTDGTKVQVEQVLAANGLGAGIAQRGLLGVKAETLKEGGVALAEVAKRMGTPISDYVLQAGGSGSVFIMAEHLHSGGSLKYLKLGDGPYYLLDRPFHLAQFEVPITIERMLAGRGPLLTAGPVQQSSVATVAKKDMGAGTRIERAIGSFDFRGEGVVCADAPDHVPMGLVEHCRLRTSVERGQTLTWDDVELEDEVALGLARKIYTAGTQTVSDTVA